MEVPTIEPEAPTQPASTSIEDIIRQAAARYGIDGDRLVALAMCESTLNPNNVNYGYYDNGYPSGLFQHLSGYFPARALKYGYNTDVFDAYSNAGVTAAMIKDGLANQWQCQY